jgi:hypothetical protein
MYNDADDIPTLLLMIVESQVLLAEVVTRLAQESPDSEGIQNLVCGVSDNNSIIIAALHRMRVRH